LQIEQVKRGDVRIKCYGLIDDALGLLFDLAQPFLQRLVFLRRFLQLRDLRQQILLLNLDFLEPGLLFRGQLAALFSTFICSSA
jgi:hypothetical protein